MRTRTALLSLGLLIVGLGTAFAQDQPAPHVTNALLNPCPETPGLILCLVEEKSGQNSVAPSPLIERTSRSTGKLTRFTRLAGMFMGRVSVATIGSMSLQINLELR